MGFWDWDEFFDGNVPPGFEVLESLICCDQKTPKDKRIAYLRADSHPMKRK